MSVLEAHNVTMRFGGLIALDRFCLCLGRGELVGLIGPNGAGKTTAFNALTGVYQPTSGEIRIDGLPAHGLKPNKLSALGVARTFQNVRLFKQMTVLENVMVAGARKLARYGIWSAVLRTSPFFREEKLLEGNARELLAIFGLDRRAQLMAGVLPYGEQRKLEIVRALATQPKALLLDEPAAGMNHVETRSLMETIARVRREFDLSILMIEHDMALVMGICDRIVVLDHGATIAQGAPDVIRRDPAVIQAYLGAPG